MIRHRMHPVLLAWSFERLSEIVTWNSKAEYMQDDECVCGGVVLHIFSFLFLLSHNSV